MGHSTFKHSKYGYETIIKVGQKVECVYYGEYERAVSYQRTWLARLIDKPFRPVKLGVVVGDAGWHPYWLAGNAKVEQYLFVRFNEYIFPKAIPITCIKDAAESAQKLEYFINYFKNRIGEHGWSKESYDLLKNRVEKAKKFISK